MTLGQTAFKPGKKTFPTPKASCSEHPIPEKKHYGAQKPNPIIFGGVAEAKPKKNLKAWKPSVDLVSFNNKHTNYFVGNPRGRKEIPGESLHRSSIVNMMGMDTKAKPEIKRRPECETDMKSIITYKNGPRFREAQIADNIPKTDPTVWNRAGGLTKESHMRSMEYETNRINARGSQIVI